MRVSLFPVLVLCLVCAFSAAGQKVIEPVSTAVVGNGRITVDIVVDSPSARNVTASAELLDQRGNVQGTSPARAESLSAGRQKVTFQFPFEDTGDGSNDDLTWYRVQYRIGDAAGIMSLSQMIADLFELRIIAAESLLSGTNYRVRVRALHPFTEQPTPGVAITTELELQLKGDDAPAMKMNGTGITNAEGFAVIQREEARPAPGPQ